MVYPVFDTPTSMILVICWVLYLGSWLLSTGLLAWDPKPKYWSWCNLLFEMIDIYICICVYVYTNVYIYMYIYIYYFTHTETYTCTYTNTYTYTSKWGHWMGNMNRNCQFPSLSTVPFSNHEQNWKPVKEHEAEACIFDVLKDDHIPRII